MYLSPADLQHTHLGSLDNLHNGSLSCIEATARLAELALRSGRQALDEGRRQLDAGQPPGEITRPLEGLAQGQPWQLAAATQVREFFEIVGEAQQAMLQMARAQLALLDHAFMTQMDHAARSADAQGAAAIGHVRTAVRQAEAGFNELADAAELSTELVEEQVRQVTEALAGGEPEHVSTAHKRLPRSE